MKDKIERVKTHIKDNRRVYLAAAGGVVVGAVVVALATKKGPALEVNAFQNIAKACWKPKQTIDIHIEALGDPGNIIQDLKTGTVYASQNQLARELGVNPARISEQLSGKLDHVNGHKFVKLGKATVSESQ